MLKYKMNWKGNKSKIDSVCVVHLVKENLKVSDRVHMCQCVYLIDIDLKKFPQKLFT